MNAVLQHILVQERDFPLLAALFHILGQPRELLLQKPLLEIRRLVHLRIEHGEMARSIVERIVIA